MATVLQEGKWTGEFILSEANSYRSRDQVVIAAPAADIEPGTLLGKITASGKYAEYDNAASDGTQTAVGILLAKVFASTADVKATAFVRDCEVRESELTGLDAAGRADLAAAGIILRASI